MDKIMEQAKLLGMITGDIEFLISRLGKIEPKQEEELLQEVYKYLLDLKNTIL